VANRADWQSDTRVVLFVKLRTARRWMRSWRSGSGQNIPAARFAAHVPARIVSGGDIPRTKNGGGGAPREGRSVHGMPCPTPTPLANPDALEHFQDLPQSPSRNFRKEM